MSKIEEKLNLIQTKLVAPKGQFNSFGKYKYRSCEDILEALKPLLKETGVVLRINDELVQIGDRYYIKATAEITDGENLSIAVNAFAREPENKKGMDEAQITGATSSYARKYALNGLFCIDDTKDADSTNTHNEEVKYISDGQLNTIRDLLIELSMEKKEPQFVKYLGVETLEKLPAKDYRKAISALEAKKAKVKK